MHKGVCVSVWGEREREMGVEVKWKALQLMGMPPSPREAHVMLALDADRVLVLGGGSISPVFGPQQFNDMFVLDLKEAKWSQINSKGDQPSPRTGLSAIVLGDGHRVLIFGGSSMTEGYMNDVYILDTKEWVWSKHPVKGQFPSPRDKHTACLFGSKMYVFGGFGPSSTVGNGGVSEANDENEDHDEHTDTDADASEDDESGEEDEDDEPSMSFTWFNDLHVFDVVTMEWQRIETKGAKPSPRAAHAAFIAKVTDQKSSEKDQMIIFGGRDPGGRQNDLFSLDLQTLEWVKVGGKAPPARSFHSMVPLGEHQLAICYGGVGVNGEMFPGMELLNLESMEWTLLKSSSGVWPPLRGVSAMASCLSKEAAKLIIFGGSCSLEDRETVYYNDAYSVDMGPLVNAAL